MALVKHENIIVQIVPCCEAANTKSPPFRPLIDPWGYTHNAIATEAPPARFVMQGGKYEKIGD